MPSLNRKNWRPFRVIDGLAHEDVRDIEEDRFDKANLDLTAVSLFINRLMVIMMPLMMLIMNGLSMAIIWVGAHQIAAQKISKLQSAATQGKLSQWF